MGGAIRRGGLCAVAGLILGAAAPSAHAGDPTANDGQASVSVTVRHGLASVEAREAALADVLRAIAEQADFELSIKGDAEQTATWDFTDVPVDEAVRKVLQQVSSVATFAPNGGAVVEVHVLRSGRESRGAAVQGESVIPTMRAGIDLLEREDRIRATQSLSRQPDANAIKQLTHLVSEDEDQTVRAVAAVGLGKIRTHEAKEALIDALSDRDSLVRRRAVQGLGRLWGSDAVEPLSLALLEDLDPHVRREAALRLGKIRSEEARESLTLAETDTEHLVRRAVTHALASF
jgi:HEAT repeat protein